MGQNLGSALVEASGGIRYRWILEDEETTYFTGYHIVTH